MGSPYNRDSSDFTMPMNDSNINNINNSQLPDPAGPSLLRNSSDDDTQISQNGSTTNLMKSSTSPKDPDQLLYNGVDSMYASENTKRGCFSKIRSWYHPTILPIKDKKAGLDTNKTTIRYCGGRLKKWQFILIHLIIISLVISAIMIPITYFIIVPKIIQDKVNSMDVSTMKLEYMTLTEMSSEKTAFELKAILPPQMPLPVTPTIGAMTANLVDASSNNALLVKVHLPDFDFPMNKDIVLEFPAYMTIPPTSEPALAEIVRKISDPNIGADLKFQMQVGLNIRLWGIQWYRDLPITKDIDIGTLRGRFSDLWGAIPAFTKSSASLEVSNDRQWKMLKDLPPVTISKLDVGMRDVGPTMKTGIIMENPTVMSAHCLDKIEFNFALEGVGLGRCTVKGLQLSRGVNNLDMDIAMDFFQASGDSQSIADAISKTLDKLLIAGSTDVGFAIQGPLNINDIPALAHITEHLHIIMPMDEILQNAKIQILQKMLTLDGIRHMASKAKIAASISDSDISLPSLEMSLPKLVPLPPISLPFHVNLELNQPTTKTPLMNFVMKGMSMQMTENYQEMTIKTSGSVIPSNTELSSSAVAQVFNPMLNNRVSAVLATNIRISDSENSKPYAWSMKLFNAASIQVPLPGIDIIQILDLFTQGGTTMPVSIASMDVVQLDNEPGFNARGIMGLEYPSILPKMDMKVGYMGMSMDVKTTPLCQLSMPNGIIFESTVKSTDLNAKMVLNRDDGLAREMQGFVDAFLIDQSPASSIAISNMVFGASLQNAFKTFEKIRIEVSTDSIKSIVKKSVNALSKTLFVPGLVKVKSAGMELQSSTHAIMSSEIALANPFNFAASLGKTSLMMMIDNQKFVSTMVDPIRLERGTKPLAVKADMELSDGSDGMDGKVAQFVQQLMQANDNGVTFSAGNFVLHPVNGGNNGAIDQFASVKFVITPSLIHSIVSIGKPMLSMLDVSAILPSPETIKAARLYDISNASVVALPDARMQASATFGYFNPLPLSASIPYMQAQPIIDGSNPMLFTMDGLVLQRENGNMSPNVEMTFYNNDAAASAISTMISQLVQGEITANIGAKNIVFGTSRNDVNKLFGRVEFSMALLKGFNTNSVMDLMVKALPFKFPVSLNGMYSQFKPSINTISASTFPGKRMVASTDVSFMNPLPSVIDFGFIQTCISINSAPFVNTKLPRIFLQPSRNRSSLSTSVDMTFTETDSTPGEIRKLVDNAVAGRPFQTTLGISCLRFGKSESDRVDVFEKMTIPIPLDKFITTSGQSLDLTRIIDDIIQSIVRGEKSISLNDAKLEMLSSAQMLVEANGVLGRGSLPLEKAELRMGYVGSSARIQNVPMMDMKIPRLSLNESGAFDLSTNVLLHDDDRVVDAVQKLVDEFTQDGDFRGSIQMGGMVFGASESDLVQSFSQVYLDVPLKTIGQFAVNQTMKIMDYIVAKTENPDFIQFVNNTAQLKFSNDTKLTLHDMKCAFEPNAHIANSVKASVQVPYKFSVKMPYLEMGLGVDNIDFTSMQMTGFQVASHDTTPMSLGMNLKIHDSDSLTDKLGVVVDNFLDNKTLSNNLVVSGVAFGLTRESSIRAFSRIKVRLPLEKLIASARQFIPKDINPVALLNVFGPQLTDLSMATSATRTIDMGVQGKFKNPFPVSMSLGYASAVAGIDSVEMMEARIQNFNVIQGPNPLNVSTSVAFSPATNVSRSKVSGFVESIFTKGLGNTTAKFSANGITFGYSSTDYIKAFSKTRFLIPSAAILNKKVVDTVMEQIGFNASNLDMSKIMEKVALNKVHFGTRPNKLLHATMETTIRDLLPNVTMSMGYVGMKLDINEASIMSASLSNGMQVLPVPKGNGTFHVFADIPSTDIRLLETAEAKQQIANVAGAFLSDKPSKVAVTGVGFVFGHDSHDVIDLFDDINGFSIDLGGLVGPVQSFMKKMLNDILDSAIRERESTTLKANVTKIDMGLTEQGAFGMDIEATVDGLPIDDLNIHIPFVSSGFFLDDSSMGHVKVSDVRIINNTFSVNAEAFLVPNKKAYRRFGGDILSNIVFHRFNSLFPGNGTMQDVLGMDQLRIGHSADSAITALEKTQIAFKVEPFIREIYSHFDQNRPLEMGNLTAILASDGIETNVHCVPLSGFLSRLEIKRLPSMSAYVSYDEAPIIDTLFTDIVLKRGGSMRFKLGLIPLEKFYEPIGDIILRLLTFENYSNRTQIGGLAIHQNENPKEPHPKDIVALKDSIMESPDLYLWRPWLLKLGLPRNPFGIGFNVVLGTKNVGQLHIDVGQVLMKIKHRGTTIGTFDIDHIVFNSAHENKGVSLFESRARGRAWVMLTPMKWLDLGVDAVAMLIKNKTQNWDLDFKVVQTGDVRVSWLERALDATFPVLLGNVKKLISGITSCMAVRFSDKGVNKLVANDEKWKATCKNQDPGMMVLTQGARKWQEYLESKGKFISNTTKLLGNVEDIDDEGDDDENEFENEKKSELDENEDMRVIIDEGGFEMVPNMTLSRSIRFLKRSYVL